MENIKTPNNLPNQKKVTFVLLEEQSDGTLKVQGIKGNDKDKPDVNLDSILQKIKDGEIKLPATTTPASTTTTTSTTTEVTTKTSYSTSSPISVTGKHFSIKPSSLIISFNTCSNSQFVRFK